MARHARGLGCPAVLVPCAPAMAEVEPVRVVFPGASRINSVAFSEDGERLYAHLPGVPVVDVWGTLVHYWPELLGLAGAVLTLVLLLWVRRVQRRPRERGLAYCRRCNYLLRDCPTPVCPECALDSTRRRPVRGRAVAVRLAAPVLLLVLAWGGYGALWAAGVQRENAASRWLVWSSAGLVERADRPGFEWLQKRVVQGTRIDEVECATGKILRTLASFPAYSGATLAQPAKGEWVVTTIANDELGQISTRTGRIVGRLRVPPSEARVWSGSYWTDFAGVDGSTVYATYLDEGLRRTWLYAWDLETGRAERVLDTEAEAFENGNSPSGWMVVPRELFIVPGSKPLRVLDLPNSYGQVQGPSRASKLHEVPGGAREITFERNPYSKVHILRDGSAAFARAGTFEVNRVDLQSLAVTGRMGPPGAMTSFFPDGPQGDSGTASDLGRRLLYVGVALHRVGIWDMEEERWLGTMAIPKRVFSGLRLSPDGTRLGIVMFEKSATTGTFEHELLIYDLREVAAWREREARRNSAAEAR